MMQIKFSIGLNNKSFQILGAAIMNDFSAMARECAVDGTAYKFASDERRARVGIWRFRKLRQ